MPKEREYYRLPGNRGFTMTGRHSLWRGTDHILSLTNRGYSEEYRRFYYSDIQTITLRKTAGALIGNIVLGALAFLPALAAYQHWRKGLWEDWAAVTVLSFAGFFFLLLLINVLRGPTCKTYLRTAVQLQMLPSLRRMRTAHKTISILQPLIEAAQGAFTQEQLNLIASAPAVPFVSADRRPPAAHQKPVVHDEGNVHGALFLVLLINGLSDLAKILYYNGAIRFVSSILFLGVVVLAVFSMVRQRNSDLPIPIRKTVTWIFGFAIVRFLAAYIFSVYIFTNNMPGFGRVFDPRQFFFSMKPIDSVPLLILVLFSGAGALILSSVGLSQYARMRKTRNYHRVTEETKIG